MFIVLPILLMTFFFFFWPDSFLCIKNVGHLHFLDTLDQSKALVILYSMKI